MLLFQTLGFQAREEALHRRVVVAIATSRHALQQLVVVEFLSKQPARVLAATIGMHDQARRWRLAAQSHRQGVYNQRCVDRCAHRPSHDLLGTQILHRGDVQKSLVCRDIGDVREPDAVGPGALKMLIQTIWGDWKPVIRVGGAASLLPMAANNAIFSHQSPYSLAADGTSTLFEGLVDPRTAVSAETLSVNRANFAHQRGICVGAL